MRTPIGAGEVIGESAFDASEAKHRFCVVRAHGIPETPEIFEGSVTLAVEESVLKAVRFVARKAISHMDDVTRFEPTGAADHRYHWIRNIFPGNPVIPTEHAPGNRVVADFKLRFKDERNFRRSRRVAKTGGNGFERVEIDPISANLFEQVDDGDAGIGGLVPRAGVPSEDREENFDVMTVKIGDEFLKPRNAAGKIAQEVELIAIVDADVGINVPEKDNVDGADTFFSFTEKFVDGVLVGPGIVERTVPHEKLHLGKGFAYPCEFRPRVFGAIISQTLKTVGTPGLQIGAPRIVCRGIGWSGKEDFRRRRRIGQRQHAAGNNEAVARFPLVGVCKRRNQDGAKNQNGDTKRSAMWDHGCIRKQKLKNAQGL